MAITFAGQSFPGIVLPYSPDPPQSKSIQRSFMGVAGESFIQSPPGGRLIAVPMWVYGGYRIIDALTLYIESLDRLIDEVGTLTITNAVGAETFTDCAFKGFKREASIVKDIAGTLDGGYFTRGVYVFYQLRA